MKSSTSRRQRPAEEYIATLAGRFLTRLLRRPGTAAACLCAAAVILAGCGSVQAGQQSGTGQAAGRQAPAAQAASLTLASSGTWQAQNSDTRHRLYDVACLSALRCEAVGTAGTIVFTADGGRIWRQQANPLRGSSATLYQITCVAPSSCYVIARPDTILVTHNSGATWSRHVLPVGTEVTDQACLGFSPIAGQYSACRLGLLDISCVRHQPAAEDACRVGLDLADP
jgi:hypothetical protein